MSKFVSGDIAGRVKAKQQFLDQFEQPTFGSTCRDEEIRINDIVRFMYKKIRYCIRREEYITGGWVNHSGTEWILYIDKDTFNELSFIPGYDSFTQEQDGFNYMFHGHRVIIVEPEHERHVNFVRIK